MNCRTSTPFRPFRPALPPRRGVALLLVLGVVIMASVLGYAMLSSAAMTKQTSSNAAVTASAQGIAESGVNLALYYLQNPESAPTYPKTYPATEEYDRTRQFWEGTGGQFIDIGSPSVGQVKVLVERPNEAVRWFYKITAYGRAPGSTLDRRVEVTTFVNAEYRFDHAAMTSADVSWTGNTRIEGDAYSNAGLTIRSGGALLGRATRRKVTSTPVTPTGGWQNPAPLVPKVIPRFDEIRTYLKYEKPLGKENSARVLSQTELGSPGILGIGATSFTSAPTTDNPAGVLYVPGNLTIHSGATIHGTLIVGGNLSIRGNNIHIRSEPGFPALLVGGNVDFGTLLSIAPGARVDGVMYVAGRVDGTGLLPTLDVEGSMLVGGGAPVFPTLTLSTLRVKYNRDQANIPDFSEVGRTPISVKVIDWQAQ